VVDLPKPRPRSNTGVSAVISVTKAPLAGTRRGFGRSDHGHSHLSQGPVSTHTLCDKVCQLTRCLSAGSVCQLTPGYRVRPWQVF
jgi:hypothetical protein